MQSNVPVGMTGIVVAPLTFLSNREDSKTMVRKILCLHDGGGDAKKFKFDSGMTDLKNALGNVYEFVFAQAKEGGCGCVTLREEKVGRLLILTGHQNLLIS